MAKKSPSASVLAKQYPAGSYEAPESHSVQVRPIANGYLTEICHSEGGEYSRKEIFSQEKPALEPGLARKDSGPGGGKALRGAIESIRGKK